MSKTTESSLTHGHRTLLVSVVIILIVIAIFLIVKSTMKQSGSMSNSTQSESTIPTTEPVISTNPSESSIAPEERSQIDVWIEKNDLNFYGDPKDMVYAGGTPLFDESTGKYIDRYEYIVNNHPDRPWAN